MTKKDKILKYRGLGYTQKEIGEMLGISQVRVSQIERNVTGYDFETSPYPDKFPLEFNGHQVVCLGRY